MGISEFLRIINRFLSSIKTFLINFIIYIFYRESFSGYNFLHDFLINLYNKYGLSCEIGAASKASLNRNDSNLAEIFKKVPIRKIKI